ncbi:MAG: hypothetical protein R2762_11500 [Bryobacteraceae bacterium]
MDQQAYAIDRESRATEVPPEKAMNDLKTYASRARNGLETEKPGRTTRWMWKDQDVREAIRSVIEEQGGPITVFLGDVP